MGYWGSYIGKKPSMSEIRKRIEDDVKCDVVSLKFGHAICVVREEHTSPDYQTTAKDKYAPDCVNMIIVVLWHISNYNLMIKQIGESSGPYLLDVPLKYVNTPCKATEGDEFSIRWRQEVREYHASKRQVNNYIKNLKPGDKVMLNGGESFWYAMPSRSQRYFIGRSEIGVQYRIRKSEVKVPV